MKPRRIHLMSAKPIRKREPWLKWMTHMQYRARYRASYLHYVRLSARLRAESYRAWAVFTVL